MKIYRLMADAVFRAESVDDAFIVLAEHLTRLVNRVGEIPQVLLAGSLKIEPYEQKKREL
jgi:hypothetical protein